VPCATRGSDDTRNGRPRHDELTACARSSLAQLTRWVRSPTTALESNPRGLSSCRLPRPNQFQSTLACRRQTQYLSDLPLEPRSSLVSHRLLSTVRCSSCRVFRGCLPRFPQMCHTGRAKGLPTKLLQWLLAKSTLSPDQLSVHVQQPLTPKRKTGPNPPRSAAIDIEA